MTKPKTLDPLTRARRALIKAGAAPADVDAFELAVLTQVMQNLSIGGEITQPTRDRYDDLRGVPRD